MSLLAITNAGVAYKDAVFSGEEVQNITRVIFRNVAGLIPETAIELTQPVPTSDIVHSEPIHRVSASDDNAVVISTILGYDIGDFDYNWYGVIAEKADLSEVLIAVVQTPVQTKTKTAGAVTGNYSVKSIVWKTANIAQSLNVTLSTLPWQVQNGTFVTRTDYDNDMPNKLDVDAQAVDSNKLDGKTRPEIITEAREGLSPNTDTWRGISSSVSSTSTTVSASSSAVRTAYNKAVAATPIASKGTNGYWKCLATGLIIQWGYLANTTTGTTYTISFPIAFPSVCVSLSTELIEPTLESGINRFSAWSKAKNSFTFRNEDSSNLDMCWIAIGY